MDGKHCNGNSQRHANDLPGTSGKGYKDADDELLCKSKWHTKFMASFYCHMHSLHMHLCSVFELCDCDWFILYHTFNQRSPPPPSPLFDFFFLFDRSFHFRMVLLHAKLNHIPNKCIIVVDFMGETNMPILCSSLESGMIYKTVHKNNNNKQITNTKYRICYVFMVCNCYY